jgi:hypothetical protein
VIKFFLASLIFLPLVGHAYPDFIAYGYRACMTCHYNGHGNGGLNDYGRALFATEIASRWIYDKSKPEDEIASQNNFFGATELPYWIRPSLKLRALSLMKNPGSSSSENRLIPMQADMGVAMMTESQEFGVVATGGYLPKPIRFNNSTEKPPSSFLSREYYLRWSPLKNLWLYGGLMDKVFGIRVVDHTAYSRSKTGLGQNDQSHGLVMHWIQSSYELSANIFAGNVNQDEKLRPKGVSIMAESEVSDRWAVGSSVLSQSNNYLERTLLSFHTKAGLNKPGNGIMAEVGFIKDTTISSQKSQLGYYSLLQSMLKISRGYNFVSTFENYKADITTASTESIRWSGGLLAFPMPKTEARIGLVNYRTLSPSQGTPDQWALQSQIHVSW